MSIPFVPSAEFEKQIEIQKKLADFMYVCIGEMRKARINIKQHIKRSSEVVNNDDEPFSLRSAHNLHQSVLVTYKQR